MSNCSLHLDRLNRIPETKYLGYSLSEDHIVGIRVVFFELAMIDGTESIDAEDIAKQMRTLYIRFNKLLRMFSYCTIDVKMELFRSYCSPLYCCSLWSDYRKASYKKLTVAFNNVHRRMLNLP